MKRAILSDKKVVPVDDILEWARWFEAADRTVARTNIEGSEVSTVFLGIDHGFSAELWFESMVFGGENDQHQERYRTYGEALLGHERIVEALNTKSKLE